MPIYDKVNFCASSAVCDRLLQTISFESSDSANDNKNIINVVKGDTCFF